MESIKTEKLLQMYANAVTTSGCGGHWKGSQNERLYREYAIELEKRGVFVPKSLTQRCEKDFKTNVDIPEGVFNGEGTY